MAEAVDRAGRRQDGGRLARLFFGPTEGMEVRVVVPLAVDADVNVFAGDGDRGVP